MKSEGALDEAERLGCGDNSCVFGAPKGMGTNGGCRCLRYPEQLTPTISRLLKRWISNARAQLQAKDAEIERIAGVVGDDKRPRIELIQANAELGGLLFDRDEEIRDLRAALQRAEADAKWVRWDKIDPDAWYIGTDGIGVFWYTNGRSIVVNSPNWFLKASHPNDALAAIAKEGEAE